MAEEYLILAKKSHESLTDVVNQYIQRGWEPVGGITTRKGSVFEYYYQAIVRYSNN